MEVASLGTRRVAVTWTMVEKNRVNTCSLYAWIGRWSMSTLKYDKEGANGRRKVGACA